MTIKKKKERKWRPALPEEEGDGEATSPTPEQGLPSVLSEEIDNLQDETDYLPDETDADVEVEADAEDSTAGLHAVPSVCCECCVCCTTKARLSNAFSPTRLP